MTHSQFIPEMFRFKVIIKLNGVKETVFVTSQNNFTAKMLVMTSKCCPSSNVISIKEIKEKEYRKQINSNHN